MGELVVVARFSLMELKSTSRKFSIASILKSSKPAAKLASNKSVNCLDALNSAIASSFALVRRALNSLFLF